MNTRTAQMPAKNRSQWFVLLLIATLGLAIYGNTFHAGFHLDDVNNIVDNPAIKYWSHWDSIWASAKTRFITQLSIALNYRFGKLNVVGYHLANIAIHVLCSILVYQLLRLTFRTPTMPKRPAEEIDLLSLGASLIFLTHPIQTQSVTYIIQRAASLATLFYLAALVFYVQFRLEQKTENYWLALLATLLAMFTKPIAFTLPVAILLYELVFFKDFQKNADVRIGVLVPFFLTMAIIPYLLILEGGGLELRDITKETLKISRGDYLLTQFNVIRTYLRLLILPINQNLDYDYPISTSLMEPKTLASLGFILFLLFIAFRTLKRKPLVAFGIVWFFLTLSIESSIIPISDVIFEHRLYLPMVGFSITASAVLWQCFQNARRFAIALLVIALCLCGLTYARNRVWKDDVTLWQDVVKKSPNKARPHNILGTAYAHAGNETKALEHYHKAHELNPNYALSYNNLGLLEYYKKNYDKAVTLLEKAIRLNPAYEKAYNNLGLIYEQKGDQTKAVQYFQKAIDLYPIFALPYSNLGAVHGKMAQYEKAIQYFEKAAELDPDNPTTWFNLGVAYAKTRRPEKAIAPLERAVRLKPGYAEAHALLAESFQKTGNPSSALNAIRILEQMGRDDLANPLKRTLKP